MQDVSYKFKRMWADITSTVEIRATINNVLYGKEDLYGAETSVNVLTNNKPGVGGTVSNTYTVTILPKNGVNIPRGATVSLEARLVTDDEESEWIPKGTFYIDSRETTSDGLQTKLYCYDAFLKAEQTYPNVGTETWPKTESTVVATILSLMGITLDSRTTLQNYNVEYPGDLTCREILGYIAAANGGNWTITDENKLRLVSIVPDLEILARDNSTALQFGNAVLLAYGAVTENDILRDENDRIIVFGDGLGVGRNVELYHDLGSLDAFSKVIVWWSDEDAFEAGTDGGAVLELDCPWATQAMANNLLSLVEGMTYHAYDVQKAALTPAAEMGDMVVVDGHPMPLLSLKVSYDGGYFPDIAAPPDDEVDSEYPYETQTQKQLARRVKLGSNYYGVSITRENGIEITKTDGNNTYSRATLNSDVLAFYDDNGTQRIYFDNNLGKFCFNGDVTITSGSIDINNGQFSVTRNGVVSINSGTFQIGGTEQAPNFLVDLFGNLTTNGNVTLQGANTTITAPNIYGGTYYNANGSAHLEIGSDLEFWASHTVGNPIFSLYDDIGTVELQFYGQATLRYNDMSGETLAVGEWMYPNSGHSGSDAEIATIGDIPDISWIATEFQNIASEFAAVWAAIGNLSGE